MDELTEREQRAYRAGFADAMSAWAWWKDGVEYLGSGMSKLSDWKGREDKLMSYTPRLADTSSTEPR